VRESALFYCSRAEMPLHSKEEIIRQVEEITGRVGRKENIEPVEVELLGGGKSRTLRIYIDKPGGVTHSDCEFISDQVGAILDGEDIIPGDTYKLEVSSPGVERKLIKPADYQRFKGQKVKVILREPVETQKHWEGILEDFDGTTVTLTAGSREIRFPLDQVQKANLKFEW
jgi:ribosome maturation factor RimP